MFARHGCAHSVVLHPLCFAGCRDDCRALEVWLEVLT